MPRPIKKRTAKSYHRDIEALGRLRTAIKLDLAIDHQLQVKAASDIDTLTETLSRILQQQPQQP